jgi:hypothetical protein
LRQRHTQRFFGTGQRQPRSLPSGAGRCESRIEGPLDLRSPCTSGCATARHQRLAHNSRIGADLLANNSASPGGNVQRHDDLVGDLAGRPSPLPPTNVFLPISSNSGLTAQTLHQDRRP